MIYVFGHRNPDSDSICSAIITADWLNSIGKFATPYRLGEITAETAFILQQANVEAPALLEGELDDKQVWLVDFTDAEQGPASLSCCDITGIIDHHRLGSVTTQKPPEVWIRPVGCCATVIWQILNVESAMTLSESQAILLLGAIVSDTVGLTSSTTTAQDIAAAQALTSLCSIDYEAFVKGVLKAKVDLSHYSIANLLMKDAKHYHINGLSVLIAQIEVDSLCVTQSILPELLAALTHQRRHLGVDIALLAITDIYQKNSTLYFDHNNLIGLRDLSLPGVMSRKKEILPWLTETISLSTRQ